MSDLLKSINERISSYQLFNFFYPGAIFLGILKCLQCDFVDSLSIWYFLLFSYFVGMTSSRIGSIVIEDLFVCLKWIKKHDYKKQTEAEKKDPKVMLLLEICNTYRTLGSVFLVLSLICLILSIKYLIQVFCSFEDCSLFVDNLIKSPCPMFSFYTLIFILMTILFIFSFRKQYIYVEERIQANFSE